MDTRRHGITEWLYPNKITVEQFTSLFVTAVPKFSAGMNRLEDIGSVPGELHIEEWFELFAEWLEVRREDDPSWRNTGVGTKNSPAR